MRPRHCHSADKALLGFLEDDSEVTSWYTNNISIISRALLDAEPGHRNHKLSPRISTFGKQVCQMSFVSTKRVFRCAVTAPRATLPPGPFLLAFRSIWKGALSQFHSCTYTCAHLDLIWSRRSFFLLKPAWIEGLMLFLDRNTSILAVHIASITSGVRICDSRSKYEVSNGDT